MSLLEVKTLSKRFGGVEAVSSLSFGVQEGELIGLVGPNGAGKSTLFSLLSGMLLPTSGRIIYQGQNVTKWPPYRRCHHGIVQTFQLARPFPGLTVERNIMVGAEFGHLSFRSQSDREIQEILEFTKLEHVRSLRAEHLNTAGRKRLEVARALAASPKLLLLDEVMAGLAEDEVGEVMDMIRAINKRGVTIIATEHVMSSILRLVRRLLVLHHGQLVYDGDPMAATKNAEVIDAYLGVNVLPGQHES